MKDGPRWLRRFVGHVFDYRYLVCLIIVVSICILGWVLYCLLGWPLKDVAQVCTGFFIVLTLFFTALNYEFTANKTRQDIKSAKETLTYNVAAEWHKSPLKEYQKTTIEFEKKFIRTFVKRTVVDFSSFIEGPENLDYKESLKGLLNYFETVSIAAYRGVIDRDFIREFHDSIFRTFYVDYILFIEQRRSERKNDAIWKNFTKLVEEWNHGLRQQITDKVLISTVIL